MQKLLIDLESRTGQIIETVRSLQVAKSLRERQDTYINYVYMRTQSIIQLSGCFQSLRSQFTLQFFLQYGRYDYIL